MLSKKQLLLLKENFGNPVLDPSIYGQAGNPFFFNSNICGNDTLPPSEADQKFGCSGDILSEPMMWSDPNTVWQSGKKLVLGATIINGMPLTGWGSMFVGTDQWQKSNVMSNMQWLDQMVQTVFPRGLGHSKFQTQFQSILALSIIEMTPLCSGIGQSLSIEFTLLDGDNKEVGPFIAKIKKWPFTINDFVCEPLNKLQKEDYIKLVGQIRTALIEWLKPTAGIWICTCRELVVWNGLGQIKRLHAGDQIEVLQSNEEKIRFQYDGVEWFIKGPSLMWFNWHFKKK